MASAMSIASLYRGLVSSHVPYSVERVLVVTAISRLRTASHCGLASGGWFVVVCRG